MPALLASPLAVCAPFSTSRTLGTRSHRSTHIRQHIVITRAQQDGGDGKDRVTTVTRPGPHQRVEQVERILSELQVDRQMARQLLRVWKQAGVTNSAELREYLKKKGSAQSAAATTQLVLNAGAAVVAWWTASQITPNSTFAITGEFIAYATALYLTLSASTELLNVWALGVATRRYSSNAEGFLTAIERVAGPESGLAVLDKARQAVVTVQVISALETLLQRLKTDAVAARSDDFFRDLGAYLVLSQAAKRGFEPSTLGVDANEAAAAAAEFALADNDDDGRIDLVEFRRLTPTLNEDEAYAAISLLDTNKDGAIEFSEWLRWWVKQREE